MQQELSLGLITAVITGGLFAVLVSIEGSMARVVGAINASLLEHLVAGGLSVIVVVFLILRGGFDWSPVRGVLPQAALAGVIVLVAVAGVAYAMPRVGVLAGVLALFFGQMGIAVLIDSIGLAGYEKIPLSPQRIIGLLIMTGGIYLVVPRNG